ncbi:MAG: glycosyltransferase family 39 protein [Gemmatimonadota bacterium]
MRRALPLAVVMLLGGTLLWWCGLRGWYAHDEGLLGQSAARVLRGEVPHRDFTDPYTGGLSFLHALLFQLFGARLDVLRRAFDVVAWGWLALLYLLARRWLPRWGAALAALVALTWSVPIYPAAMPSWYVLFGVTAALAILVQSGATDRRRALLLAGACLGVALLAKVTALYALAGALIALGRIRQIENSDGRARPMLLAGAAAFIVAAVAVVSGTPTPRVLLHVLFPTVGLVAVVLVVEVRTALGRGVGGDAVFRRQVTWIVAGVALPVLPFLAWLAAHGALAPLLHSLAGVAGQRAANAHQAPPTVMAVLYGIPLLLLLVGVAARQLRLGLLLVVLAILSIAAWDHPPVHRAIWLAVRGVVPLGAAWLVWAWATSARDARIQRPDHVLVVLVGSAMVLSQFPFAAEIYYAYLVPLAVLGLLAFVPTGRPARVHAIVTAAGLLTFALVQIIPGTPMERGMGRVDAPALTTLPGQHGGLLVLPAQAERYRQLLGAIAEAHDTMPIWAGPDAPEVAFLAGRIDRNNNFFAFLDPSTDGVLPAGDLLMRRGVRTVVVQLKPPFSAPIDEAALMQLGKAFPYARRVGTFEVRWREGTP